MCLAGGRALVWSMPRFPHESSCRVFRRYRRVALYRKLQVARVRPSTIRSGRSDAVRWSPLICPTAERVAPTERRAISPSGETVPASIGFEIARPRCRDERISTEPPSTRNHTLLALSEHVGSGPAGTRSPSYQTTEGAAVAEAAWPPLAWSTIIWWDTGLAAVQPARKPKAIRLSVPSEGTRTRLRSPEARSAGAFDRACEHGRIRRIAFCNPLLP